MRELRLQDLRGLVDSLGALEVDVASERLGVSRETIRRDMGELAEKGLIRRTRGGAASLSRSLTERDLDQRQFRNSAQKAAIAQYVADEFVRDGMAIALDGGTTAMAIAKALAGRDLTIVTASIPIVMELSHSSRTSVIVVGGELRKKSMTAGGPYASSMMDHFRTDIAFVSGPAISVQDGLMDSYAEGVALKHSMIEHAATVYAVLDSSKLGGRSFVTICDARELDGIVTDSSASKQQLAEFAANDIPMHIAK
ncbi:MAG: DeoR/GlpR transcriptional regulator [Microbacteriaceae bacterium]|nr:MAG: DeoR/GlpR transcriptional regulator [Microbacteriaceae bacterium]